jgi:hypothetical protein
MRRIVARHSGAGLIALSALFVTGCIAPPEIPGPRSPECREVRGIAVSRTEGSAGEASATEAADRFLAAQGVDKPSGTPWKTTSGPTETRASLEWYAWLLQAERDEAGWFIAGAQQCMGPR